MVRGGAAGVRTVWLTGAAAGCGWKLKSPPLTAERVCRPGVASGAEAVATPAADSGATATTAAPSKMVTLPVGRPLPATVGVTVTVTVTGSPGLVARTGVTAIVTA